VSTATLTTTATSTATLSLSHISKHTRARQLHPYAQLSVAQAAHHKAQSKICSVLCADTTLKHLLLLQYELRKAPSLPTLHTLSCCCCCSSSTLRCPLCALTAAHTVAHSAPLQCSQLTAHSTQPANCLRCITAHCSTARLQCTLSMQSCAPPLPPLQTQAQCQSQLAHLGSQ
jgi:hypothetical protein